MECMNVDDASASFSSLGITTANENTQLIPQELLVVDGLPKSPGHRLSTSTSTFLSLPYLVKWHIYMHLPSRDSVALSRTCRYMHGFITFAYTHLQFLPPNSLFSLARSVHQLAEVLARSPRYAEAVRTIHIVGWDTVDVPEGWDYEAVYKALDAGIMALLENAPHINSFTLDLNPTRTINHFPQTFMMLTRVRTIRNLRLATFLAPTCAAGSDPLPAPISNNEIPPAYQWVCLSVCSGGWLPVMMRDPRNLRWFGLTILGKGWEPGDTNWAIIALRRVAEAATELETLVLNSGKHFDADAVGQMLQSGFDRGALRKLRSFSVNTDTLSLSSLRQLFRGLSRSSITHMRIVVNHHGMWLRDFGPQYISELAKLVPDLEEISLDQSGMSKAAPLPGHLGAWGEAFRMFKKLRRIVFACMFVLDLCRPRPAVDDDEEDNREDGEEVMGGDEDAGMDVDDSDGEGDEGYETDGRGKDDAEDPLAPNLVYLAAWADTFLGDHLRMPAPFSEIWFLDPRFPGQTVGGFNQRVMEGEGEDGRAEYVIYYPIRKRDGWWWDESDRIPLD